MTKQFSVFLNFRLLWPIYLFYFILIFFVQNNSFFWDKDIIYSVLATGIMQNGSAFIFENSSDIGYFAGLAFLLAGSWQLFGVSLPVMHWLMLPVSLGIVYESYCFLKRYIPSKYLLLGVIIVLLDPTLMSQSVMYSTDLFQVYFFFTAINAIMNKKRWFLSLSLLASVMVHGRGVLTVASIFFIEIAYLIIDKRLSKENWFKTLIALSWAYVPAVIFTISYFIVHYIKTGWIGYHEQSPWAECFVRVDMAGFFRNIVITTWRIIDFGRVFVYLVLIIVLIILKKNKKSIFDNNAKKIAATATIFLVVNVPNMLMYKVLSDHRYIIIFFVFASAFVCYLLYAKIQSGSIKTLLSIVLILGLGLGNLWVYPDKIAQGWSGTLAHLPFYKQRIEMLKFLEEENIAISVVGSDTPNIQKLGVIYLNNKDEGFHRKNLKKDKYVYYSNIINMFTDEEIDELKKDWIVIKKIEKLGVKSILYKNPNQNIFLE